jgi:nucleotide-binding universal stress UspA family protein
MTATAVPHATPANRPPRSSARIVVGVDGSRGSSAALAWALREARLRDAVVDAVFAWQYHPDLGDAGLGTMGALAYGNGLGDGVGDGRIADLPPGMLFDDSSRGGDSERNPPGVQTSSKDAMRHLLDAAISEAEAADTSPAPAPRRPVERRTVEGHPVDVLLSAASADDLLVVGSHGHGYFLGKLMGSITQHVVARAPCPVVVVPDHDGHPAEG